MDLADVTAKLPTMVEAEWRDDDQGLPRGRVGRLGRGIEETVCKSACDQAKGFEV